MKNKTWLKLIIILLVAFCIYKVFLGILIENTPLGRARSYSGFQLPENSKILAFEEQYSFTGEGFIFIKVKLSDLQLKMIQKECFEEGYKALTIENLISDKFLDMNPEYGIKLPKIDIRSIRSGYYKLESIDLKNLDFNISIVDSFNKQIIIYVGFP